MIFIDVIFTFADFVYATSTAHNSPNDKAYSSTSNNTPNVQYFRIPHHYLKYNPGYCTSGDAD